MDLGRSCLAVKRVKKKIVCLFASVFPTPLRKRLTTVLVLFWC